MTMAQRNATINDRLDSTNFPPRRITTHLSETTRRYHTQNAASSNVASPPSSSKNVSKLPNLSHVPCKFFKQGTCTAGSNCIFSHNRDPTSQSSVCKYFLKGNCKFGTKCALLHALSPLGESRSLFPVRRASPSRLVSPTSTSSASKSVPSSPPLQTPLPHRDISLSSSLNQVTTLSYHDQISSPSASGSSFVPLVHDSPHHEKSHPSLSLFQRSQGLSSTSLPREYVFQSPSRVSSPSEYSAPSSWRSPPPDHMRRLPDHGYTPLSLLPRNHGRLPSPQQDWPSTDGRRWIQPPQLHTSHSSTPWLGREEHSVPDQWTHSPPHASGPIDMSRNGMGATAYTSFYPLGFPEMSAPRGPRQSSSDSFGPRSLPLGMDDDRPFYLELSDDAMSPDSREQGIPSLLMRLPMRST